MSENPYEDPKLIERVLKHIVGREREVRAIVAALAAGKNILLEGPPGTTKSTILRLIAKESGVPFYMVEGSADLTPQKLIGTFNPAKVLQEGYKPEFFEPGPLTKAMIEGGILYIEEFNRMSEEAANALIRAMEERELVIPRYGIVKAKPSFRVICAMNPYDDVGTGRISRAIMDRFCRLRLDYQSREEEIRIVELKTGSKCKWLIELAVDVVRATRRHPALKMGSSIRGAIDMVLIAHKLAKFRGGYLTINDLYDAAILALSSKIWVNNPEITPEEVIKDILNRILRRKGLDLFEEFSIGEGKEEGSKDSEKGKSHDKLEEGLNDKAKHSEEINKLIHELSELSKIAPRRTALEIMHYPHFMSNILDYSYDLKASIEILDLIARTFSYLKEDLRSIAKKFATEVIVKLVTETLMGRLGKGITIGRYDGSSDDIEIDKTIEKFVEEGMSIDSLMVYKRGKAERMYALIIDRSASMGGFKIVLAALTAAILAYASGNNPYTVLAFNTKVDFLKRVNDKISVEELVNRILSLTPEGYTDIARAICEAHRELIINGARETIGILITDGEWTAGENPLKYAPLFTKLHVIGVPSKWRGFAEALAIRGHGKFYFVTSIREVPTAIKSILF